MTMVIIDIEAYPSVLAGKKNGELPETILRHLVVPGQPEVVLIDPPMRGWMALRHYVALEGAILKTTSKYDSYRPLWVQTQIFFDRYQEEYTPWGSRTCSGKTWYKINRQVASAACPGKSNHGWAMAVDCNLDDDPKVQPALEKWAVKCGFAWELLPEEPWHLHWYPGDKIPQAVLDYEGRGGDMPARFTFQDFPDQTAGGAPPVAAGKPSRVHVTDGLRYIIQQDSSAANALKTTAGFGQITNLTPTNTGLPLYKTAVFVYCGRPDTGEFSGDVTFTDEDVTKIADAVAGEIDVPTTDEIAKAVVDETHNRLAE